MSQNKVSLSFFGKSVFFPFNNINIEKLSLRSLLSPNKLKTEWQPIVETYRSAGEDLNADISQKYWRIQSMCFGYRIQKLKSELINLSSTKLSEYSLKNWLVFLYSCSRFILAFTIGLMLGRQSIRPIMRPNDPAVERMRRQYEI